MLQVTFSNTQLLIAAAIWVASNLLKAYLGKKGENLATKEDVNLLTEKVESIRATYASHLHVSQLRYSKEYELLERLVPLVVEVRDAARGLRPPVDHIDPNEPEGERKKRRLERYREAARELHLVMEGARPFYPEGIYDALRKLQDSAFMEALQFQDADHELDRDYWEQAVKSAEKIVDSANEVLDAVRQRIQVWEPPHGPSAEG